MSLINAGQIIAGTADGGGATNYVYVSVDGGYTWTQRQSTAVKSFNSVSMEGSGECFYGLFCCCMIAISIYSLSRIKTKILWQVFG